MSPKLTVYKKRGKPAYLLRLYGFKEFNKYMKTISFSNPDKLKKANWFKKTLIEFKTITSFKLVAS